MSASRRLSPLSSCESQYASTAAGSVQAYARSAQPIALRMKKSRSPRLGSISSASSVKSVAGDDQLVVERQRVHRPVRPVSRQGDDVERDVALLAVLGPAPELERGVAPGVEAVEHRTSSTSALITAS